MQQTQDSLRDGYPPGAKPPRPPFAAALSRPPGVPGAPLTESDFLLIRQAAERRKRIKSLARTALSSSVVTLLIAFSSAPFLLFSFSWDGAMIIAGLIVVGVVEHKGYRALRKTDPATASLLGKNQLALLGLIVLYCVIQMITFSPQHAKSAALSDEVRSQLTAMPEMAKGIDQQIDHWAPLLTYGFYGLVILLTAACQGGLALYYFSRKQHIEAFNAATPEWIRRVFEETQS